MPGHKGQSNSKSSKGKLLTFYRFVLPHQGALVSAVERGIWGESVS